MRRRSVALASEPIRHSADGRTEPRDEVYFRARATLADRRSFPVLVVNVSPHGLMLRTDAPLAVGEWVTVQLPVIGQVRAGIRWSLGGRMGCQLDRAIPSARYHAVLAVMARGLA